MLDPVIVPALFIALMSSLQVIAQKQVSKKLSHHTLIVLWAIGYFLLSLVYVTWHQDIVMKEVSEVSTPMLLLLLGTIVVGFITHIMYFYVVRRGKISVVTALTSTVPLFVAGLSFLIIRETLTLTQIAGMVSIVLGTVLIARV
jgi:drug/metabolite transporter (DMT)-like permease